MKTAFTDVEGVKVPIWVSTFEEIHGVTLCCITLNEEKEIKSFLEHHRPYVNSIVMVDGGSNDRTVEYATAMVDEIQIIPFTGHYSNQANRALEMARTDWILLADCDERFDKKFLENLKTFIDQEEFDCYSLPRENFINGQPDVEMPWENQDRLFRSYCRRVRPVHGEVVGYKNKKDLTIESGNIIHNSKSIIRHRQRNQKYTVFELKYKNEIGEPGSQLKDSFEAKYPSLKHSNFMVNS